MKTAIRLISISLMLIASYAAALTPNGEYQLKLLTQGGPESIKSTAESIYHAGYAEPEVADAMAEILLQNYTRNDRYYTDALAWTARAIGSLRNNRYRSALTEVLEKSSDRKLNKHIQKALKSLPDTPTDQYVKGTMNLAAPLKAAAPAPAKTAASATVAPKAVATPANAAPTKGTNPITAAVPGMSMEEVNVLCGEPTATTSHITGKAFIPFNFRGKGDVVMYALYKGQGKIVYDHASRYTTTWRVAQVILNPDESGYP